MATLPKHDTQTNRTVVLDFNGGLQVYRNHELGLNIPAQIEPGKFSVARKAGLVSTLNREYASQGIRFTTDAMPGSSAVHIGRTDAFDRYGRFLGLAEGIGSGDAFVLLDASSNDTELTDVIRHEAGHILGTLDHGGAGLARYGWETEIYDYFGASRGHEDPEYKVYLRRVTTTTYICQYVAAPAEAENIYLNSGENGRTVEYRYGSQKRQYETSTEYVTETSTEECCNTASGSRAKVIYIYGGKATHCTAEEMYVSGNFEHDTYKKNNAGEINETNITKYFNFTYYQGVATGCDISGRPDGLLDSLTKGLLSVDGNAVARQCSAYSISVRGKLEDSYFYKFYGTELETIDEYKLFNGLVENCNVIGGTLSVEFGGIANDIIVRDGGRAVIGADEDIAMWRKWAEEEALAMEEDEEPYYISKIKQKKYDLDTYGSAKANNLIVEGGNAFVNYGGELHNATIDGRLYATEGATLGGVITCKSVDLSNMTPGTNITIKLDLNDYKVANYVEEIYDDDGNRIAVIQYFANYTTRTYRYRDGAVISVTDGTFDNKDGRFNMTNWKYTFEVDIGKTDEKALPYIVVDFGGTEKDFEKGTLRFKYPSPGGGQTNPLPFQMMANKAKWEENRGDFGWYDENDEFQSSDDYYFGSIRYDASLFGEAADVLWLENGWDNETEYTVALPSDIMKGATEVLSVTEKETGDEVQTVTTELKGNKLVFKGGAESGNYSVKAEEKDGRDHECDLDLWVIPEEIPVIGKAGTKRLAEILKKMQTDGVFQFSVGLPHNIHTDLYGMPFDLSDTGITITADFPQKSFSAKIQGKLEWKLNKDTAGTGKQLKLVVDLSGDNYISITNTKGKYDWDLVGEFKIPDFKLGKFEFSNMAMKVDVGKSSYSASAYVKLPWIKYAFGGSIGFVDGYWDSMAIGVDSLNVPLGTSGLFLQKIEGGISGIATELNLTFQGTLGLTAGPTFKVEYVDWLGIDSGEYSLCEITVIGTLTTNGNLSGEAETSILGGFITGGGGAGIKDGEFFSKGKYTLLNGCITVDGELRAGLSGITITGKGKMTVPAEKIFGPLAGLTLTVNAEASINVQNPDASYVKAWSDFAVMGYQVAMGFEYSFNKGLKLLGCDDEKKDGGGSPKRNLYALKPVLFDLSPEYSLRGAAEPSASKTFTVTGSGLTLFQVNLSVSDAIMSLAFGGVEYTQADIAAGLYENMRIVNELSGLASELTGANCITVAVNDAALGEWTVNAYGDAEATFNAYSVLSTAPAPVLTAVEVGEDARSATLRYTADFSGLTDATISIFRADAGTTDFTSGSKIAEIAAADANGVYEYVMPDEVEGGDYLFYLAVNSDGRTPVYSAVSDVYTFRILDTEAPDRIQTVNSEWKSNGTVLTWEAPWDDKGVAGYKVSYRMLMEKSEDEETDSEELDGEAPEGGSEEVIEEEIVWTEADVKTNTFTFGSVPHGTYIVRVAAYDAADNLGAWSEEQPSLVLTGSNAKYKNVALTEDLELAEHESATGITAGDFAIKAETNTLISGSVLGDAETGGFVENSTVNGVVTMLADSRGFNLTVNGTLNAGGSIAGATVNDGGTLIVGSRGSANGITVNAGGSLGLRIGAEYSSLTLAYGSSLVFINSGSGNSSGKYLLTDDIRTAGTLSSLLYLDANGHKIRFEQYNQSAEYEASELYGTIDKVSFISDLDKLIGDALEMEIDSTVYGRFKIADKAQYFSGTITVIDHADRSSTEIGFDRYDLVGHAVCKLVKEENGLYLETSRAEIDAPTITAVEYADSNAYDYIDLNATPAENTDGAKRYTFRYSLNADMSDAITVESDWYGYARISKNDFVDNATYYVQVNVENIYGVTSAWSDAVCFTVVPKVLPDAPPPVIVTDATNPSSTEIYLRVDVNTNDSRIKGFRFRYADNPEMENAVIVTNNASYQNYLFLEKSEITDGIDYYVQASMKYNGEWSYWSDTVVFNTQGWDYDGIIIGPEPDGTFNEYSLYGKRAKNVRVINGGYFYGGGDVDGLIVEEGGFFRDDNATVTNAVVNGGRYWLDTGNVTDIMVNSGELRLMNGTLNGATIGVNGVMDLDHNKKFPTVTGTILIQGQFKMYYMHPGISTNAEFVFDVGAHEADKSKFFVEYIFVLGGASKFTAKLDDTPEIGEYKITSLYQAPEGGVNISLKANDGTDLGTMRIGDAPILYNGLYYSLIDQKDVAYLHVSDNQDPPFIGAVKLSKNGAFYDSDFGYTDISVSANDECDYVLVEQEGQVFSVTVGDGGSVDLYGDVFGVTVGSGGVLTMKEGSTAQKNDVDILKGGSVVIEGGSVSRDAHFNIAGTLTVNGILNRTESNPDQGSSRSHIFDFKLDQLDTPAENVMLSDFTGLQCDPGFIISVSAQQAMGEYKLIGNAAGFRGYIVLHVEGHDYSEYLYLNQECSVGNTYYILSRENDVLSLRITDTQPAHVPYAYANITEPTTKSVTVTADFDETAKKKQYSFDGITWQAYTKAIKFTQNGIVYFRALDAKGNSSEVVSYEVTNIEKSGPGPEPGPDPNPDFPADDGTANSWLYDKTKGVNEELRDSYGTTLEDGVSEVQMDTNSVSQEISGVTYSNFVGQGDEADFTKVVLDHGARLSFALEATDAVKFVVYSLVEGTGKKAGTYTMKALQMTSFKPAKGADSAQKNTKQLSLDPGEYYISMQSTNAKKGGSAFYNVSINEDGTNGSVFYPQGNNEDDWTDMKTEGAGSAMLDDLGLVTPETTDLIDDWVGFGDTVDYKRFMLEHAAELDFAFGAPDGSAKLSVCKLKETTKKGETTYSLINIKTVTIKANQASARLNDLRLEAGEYFIKAEYTNAKKGNGTDYTVSISDSRFYSDGDNGDNNWLYDKKTKEVNVSVMDGFVSEIDTDHIGELLIDEPDTVIYDGIAGYEFHNFVGFGDEADYAKISVAHPGTATFKVTATDAAKLVVYQLTYNKKGEVSGTKAVQTVTLKKNAAGLFETPTNTKTCTFKQPGDYYISVQATAKKKETTYYNVSLVSTDIAAPLLVNQSAQDMCALTGSETDSLADSLVMSDSLSFGQYDTDALAGTYLDSVQDKLFSETGNGLLASL